MASCIVRSGCSSDSANSSCDDMDHQKYTHVIHAVSPYSLRFRTIWHQRAAADKGGHQGTPDRRFGVTRDTLTSAVISLRTRCKSQSRAHERPMPLPHHALE